MQRRLLELGFMLIGPFADREHAWNAAQAIVNEANAERPLAVIGDFVIPPSNGPPSRDFQTLHLDFGIPLVPVAATDVRPTVIDRRR